MTQTSQKLNFSMKQSNIKRQTRRKITYKLNISTSYVKVMRYCIATWFIQMLSACHQRCFGCYRLPADLSEMELHRPKDFEVGRPSRTFSWLKRAQIDLLECFRQKNRSQFILCCIN